MTDPNKIIKEEIIRGCGQDDIEHVCVKKLYYRDGKVVFNKRYVPGKITSSDYWADREYSLLWAMHRKHISNVVKAVGWRGDPDGNILELETMDAGPTIADWFGTPVRVRQHDRQEEYCPFTGVDEFLKLLRGCLKALKAIHEKGVIHCDIKADNISLPSQSLSEQRMELRYDKITLIDFGYSIIRDADLPLERIVPVNFQEAHYLSLPQRRALKHDQQHNRPIKYQKLDYSCDLYSLGRMAQTIFDMLVQVADGIKPMGLQIRPRDLQRIIDRLLHFKNGIPRKYKDMEPGAVHELLIRSIDDCFPAIQLDFLTVSAAFIAGKRDKNAAALISPVSTPMSRRQIAKQSEADKGTNSQPWYKQPEKIAAWCAIITFFWGCGWGAYSWIKNKKLPLMSEPPTLSSLYEDVRDTDFWRTGKEPKPKNWNTFIDQLKSEASQGNHEALAIISGLRHTGRGVKQDTKAAFHGYRTVLEGGNVGEKLLRQVKTAAGIMAREALESRDKHTLETILPDIRAMAEQGHPYWQAVMGEAYRLGVTGEVDMQTAATWFEKAAAQQTDRRVQKWAADSLKLVVSK